MGRLPATPEAAQEAYERNKANAQQRMSAISAAGRTLGDIPDPFDPDRRAACRDDFRRFCETYQADTYQLAWSPDHLRVIAKIEAAVLRGGLFALAMPRGTGKTTLCESAALWAMIYGHREFVCLIGADKESALQMLDAVKAEFEGNEILAEDFPEVCLPIQALEGIPHRCMGQMDADGNRTHIGWSADEIVLPTIPGSAASGAIVRCCGITGRIRGMKFRRPDGKVVRPSLAIIDDPQTDQSARSLTQCQNREAILAGAVLGLAGPGKKIAGIMPCTVIRPGDMADEILDQDKHPDWQGERARLVYDWPANEELWNKYADIRADALREDGNIEKATDFYKQNQAEMDAGSKVAWPERFNHDEISALQHAYNLKLQDAAAFAAEYQNEPEEAETDQSVLRYDVETIVERVNGFKKSEIPDGAEVITVGVDVQDKILYYLVAAWSESFRGYVLDYGTWPRQRDRRFLAETARNTLAKKYSTDTDYPARIWSALTDLEEEIFRREYAGPDGTIRVPSRVLIDAAWHPSTDAIYSWCRQAKSNAVVIPAHGHFCSVRKKSMDEWKRQRGDTVGDHWRIMNRREGRSLRHVVHDPNHWKSVLHAKLTCSQGDPASLSLYGFRNKTRSGQHEHLAEHINAERAVKISSDQRSQYEWRPEGAGHANNHWLDCLVLATVGASIEGVKAPGAERRAAPKKNRRRLSLSEIQQQKRRA